jgi:hypothetical protein
VTTLLKDAKGELCGAKVRIKNNNNDDNNNNNNNMHACTYQSHAMGERASVHVNKEGD